jgi:hypothetical protein
MEEGFMSSRAGFSTIQLKAAKLFVILSQNNGEQVMTRKTP